MRIAGGFIVGALFLVAGYFLTVYLKKNQEAFQTQLHNIENPPDALGLNSGGSKAGASGSTMGFKFFV